MGAMAFAASIMILYSSLLDGFLLTMKRNAVDISLGELQIHQKGYRDDPDLYSQVTNLPFLLKELEKSGIYGAPRLYAVGLTAAGENSAGVVIRGVDVDAEKKVTSIDKHVLKGNWLSPGSPREIVIGRKLSKNLGVGIGDEVVLLSQAADGSMANDLYRVRGVLKTIGSTIDSGGFFMVAGEFRTFMLVGDGAHEIALKRMDNSIPLADVKKEVEADLKRAGSQEGEVLSWRELKPVLSQLLQTTDAALLFMLLITYTAIGMVTLNAMLMSVFERMKEFGVMKALGVQPSQIIALIMTEAAIQGIGSAIVALFAGGGISKMVEKNGIDLTGIIGNSGVSIAGIAMDPVWHGAVSVKSIGAPITVLLVVVGISVIYPAIKAAYISPVSAMRHL
jgi:ABC-type lipoprotein release transport system permease subunit